MAKNSKMKNLSLYILTFNCGLELIDTNAFASQLFNGLTTPQLPDILVLSLQEIAPLPYSLIGGSFLIPYLNRFHDAVEIATKNFSSDTSTSTSTSASTPYTSIAARNIGMTAIMIFARDPTLIRDLEAGSVGVGLWEMGYKGAIGIRFTYGHGSSSTELTFVAAHLAAMETELQRRNEDWKNIVRGLVFSSTRSKYASALPQSEEDRPLLSISSQDASIYKSTSHLFLAGDLNYRTSIISPAPNDHMEVFPQPHDTRGSARHWESLLGADQLTQEREAGRTCHGLREARITFPPTYKYKSEGPFMRSDSELDRWAWAKHRWPSWTDRILYLEEPGWMSKSVPQAKIEIKKYDALPLLPTSDHRAVFADIRVPLLRIEKPEEEGERGGDEDEDPRVRMPFDVDIDWKKKRERARVLELVVGWTLYLTATGEGAGLLGAMIVGSVGAVYVMRAVLGS